MIFKGQLGLIVLYALKEQDDLTGYALIKETAKIYGKRPSTGTMYPLLENLKNKGFITVSAKVKKGASDKVKKKTLYKITEKGDKHYYKETNKLNKTYQKLIKLGIIVGEK